MEHAGTMICPSCGKVIPAKSTLCITCGKDSQDLYVIVPDGSKYGIWFMDEIRIHGLGFEKARKVATLLNSVTEAKD